MDKRKLLQKNCSCKLNFDFFSGADFPRDLDKYKLVIHCGGCMLTEREMKYRAALAEEAGVPFTNYGMTLAHANGILARSLAPLADVLGELDPV